ncbi:hypothetical protein LIER_08536 [Lithospermum erythrorhizon]|uniref:Uncharacterized protein n=1 Tax=Lithospermum erythrorhizon TaxID=34254 RepID=A0AAV3PCH8_LITER
MNSGKDPNFIVDLHFALPSNLFRLPFFSKRKKGLYHFPPSKILYFAKHGKLLMKLGFWDFVHIGFDRTVRIDLIAQLVATYDSKARCSFVDGVRIRVNRPDLGGGRRSLQGQGACARVGWSRG